MSTPLGDEIDRLKAENERLREVLEYICNGCEGRVDRDHLSCRYARAALGDNN